MKKGYLEEIGNEVHLKREKKTSKLDDPDMDPIDSLYNKQENQFNDLKNEIK